MSLAPPLNSGLVGFTHSGAQPVPVPANVPAIQPLQTFIEKLYIGLDQAPHSFNLREKVLGVGSANLQYITKETGVQISLRGIGSLYTEPSTNAELQEPLHLLLEHQRYENLNSATELAKNLIETLHQEYNQFQQTVGGAQMLPTTHMPAAQLTVPPPNVIASVPPPTMAAAQLLQQQQQQLSLAQQQFMPQNGLHMQWAQNGMIVQQSAPNFSMPPPATGAAQSPLLPVKAANNQLQLQLQQPSPGTMSAQHGPIIFNTQPPQTFQYQYIQQTTRDMQGNQQVTLQPVIQQTHFPMHPQQQFFTVQQGNTAYMVPQQTIIQQTPLGMQQAGAAQFSIIHQSALPPHLQMQFPPPPSVNMQPQTHAHTTLARQDLKTELFNDTLPTSSTTLAMHDAPIADPNSQEDTAAESLQLDGVTTEQLNKLALKQSQRAMPFISVPPPPPNMSVPPPAQPVVGNNLLSGPATMANLALPQQQVVSAPTHGQTNLISNNISWQQGVPPAPALQSHGQPLMDVQQMPSTGQPQSVALTFTPQSSQVQQPLATQQIVQLQPPPPQQQQQHQQQFSFIQTSPLGDGSSTLQQQQILQFQQIPSNSLQVQQQQQQPLHFSQQQQQQQLLQQQQICYQLQQSQLGESISQILDGSVGPVVSNVRAAQKRRSTSEQESASVEGPSPNQKIRSGIGSQSGMINIVMNSPSASTGSPINVVESGGVCGSASFSTHSNSGNALQFPQQHASQQQQLQQPQQQLQQYPLPKPTHIGVMRYNNQDNVRSAIDTTYPPPRARLSNLNSAAPGVHFNTRPAVQQQKQQNATSNIYGQRMQIMHTQPPPPLLTTNAYGGAAPRRMPRP